MIRGLFLRMMSTYHDGVDNLDDIDLGDDFWPNYVSGWWALIMMMLMRMIKYDYLSWPHKLTSGLFLRMVGADHDGVGASSEDCSNVGQE